MRKNPSYTALLRPTRLLISEKSATYTIKWSYIIIWQVRVVTEFVKTCGELVIDGHFLGVWLVSCHALCCDQSHRTTWRCCYGHA